ncbi:NmrA family NAD(P)-binding protein [Bdellovibrio reynosensis]|uniref:NmrA family NAD(P)-binding protein n=1 Tax=Bdellovibrio reynosensis TaxID=2835041 RepID=A0ABY4CE58_9BACT|nr:NmrA family NAD(P)-binding protein [Bdellovibrio reynosensis]UOF02177.1 NmrA family NAD(P)-binding protein [Bdellovibrio reynosensis]
MGLKIMVTGAGGTMGQEVVSALHRAGAQFTAVSRSLERLPSHVKGLQLDYDNPLLLQEALRGVDILFLSQPYESNMLAQAENIVKAARKAGVEFIVRLSGLGADERSSYLYQRIQGEVDALVESSGIPFTILKPNIFMQCFVKSFGDAIRQGVLFLPQGEGRTSYLDARDAADVAANILQNPWHHSHKTFTLTGERPISNAEAISLISHQVRRRLAYVPVTEEVAVKEMLKTLADPWVVDVAMSVHKAAKEGAIESVSETLVSSFGKAPRKFEDFCVEMKEHWEVPGKMPQNNLSAGIL